MTHTRARAGIGRATLGVCLATLWLNGCSVIGTTAAVAVGVAGTAASTAIAVGGAAAGLAIETGKVAVKATGAAIDAASGD